MMKMLHLLLLITWVTLASPSPWSDRHVNRQRRSGTSYTIGLLVKVDYSLYKSWLDNVNSEGAAVKEIQLYFIHAIKKVNQRYSTLEDPQYSLNVVLQGLSIAKSPQESSWIEGIREDPQDRKDLVQAEQALDSLSEYISSTNQQYYSQFDHILAVTGYDLYASDGGGRKILSKVGTAYLSGICEKGKGVSLMEDNRDYTSVISIAHEMAHNLNATHDGDNGCSVAAKNIMAPYVENPGLVSDTMTNPFTSFSSCTTQEIGRYLWDLQGKTYSCLTGSVQAYSETAGLDQVSLQQPPGQRYNLDAQCRIIVGQASLYCGVPGNAEELCQALLCQKGIGCFKFKGHTTFDGTSCGYKKWCVEGACVANDAAPEVTDDCPFGDYRFGQCDRSDIRFYCYNQESRRLCCQTCENIRNASYPECEYGDRSSQCETLDVKGGGYCKVPSNAEICCKTCEQALKCASDGSCPRNTPPTRSPISSGHRTSPTKTVLNLLCLACIFMDQFKFR